MRSSPNRFHVAPVGAIAVALGTLVTGWILGGCSSNSPVPAASEARAAVRLEARSIGSISRLQAYGEILLAGQPSPEDFGRLAEDGVKTVVDLRAPSEHGDFDEGARVRGLGLEYVNIPIAGAGGLDDDAFLRVREVLRTGARPLLLHCASANRVGAVWIPWRVLDGELEVDAAVIEAKQIGLRSEELERKARDYVERQRGDE